MHTPHTIRIVSSIPGFRRAGIAHPAQPTDYPIENFTEEQIQQLVNEPRLSVLFIADDLKTGTETPPGDDGRSDGASDEADAAAGTAAASAASDAAGSTTGDGAQSNAPQGGAATAPAKPSTKTSAKPSTKSPTARKAK